MRIGFLSLGLSITLFILAMIGENFRVQTTQPDGLAEIIYPYSAMSLYANLAAIGLLLFGIVLSVSSLTHGEDNVRRKLSGSALFAAGLLLIAFPTFLSLANYLDEQVRCFTVPDVCPASTFGFYNSVYIGSAIGIILGVASLVLGISLLRKHHNPRPISRVERSPELQ